MGMYEYTLGNLIIPGMLLTLALMALGKGRRVINGVVLAGLQVSIHIGGVKIRLFPMVAFINVFNFVVLMQRIHDLRNLHSKEEAHDHSAHTGIYMEELLLNYRNLVLNLCSALLIIQIWITGAEYESYKPIKDEADRMKKEFYGK